MILDELGELLDVCTIFINLIGAFVEVFGKYSWSPLYYLVSGYLLGSAPLRGRSWDKSGG